MRLAIREGGRTVGSGLVTKLWIKFNYEISYTLRSFDNELINLASQQLRSTLVKTECKLNGTVALPTKLNVFVYYVHPMLIKTLVNILNYVYISVLLI
jgi:hypothetical protein